MIETTLVDSIDPVSLYRLIDRNALFLQHWRFRKNGLDPAMWSRRVAAELEPMLFSRLRDGASRGVWTPCAVFATIPTWSDGDDMVLGKPGSERADPENVLAVFRFVRGADGRCLSDRVPTIGGRPGVTGWFVATVGPGFKDYEASLKNNGDYEEYHLFHGLSVALAEALAEEIHARLRVVMGIAGDDSPNPAEIVRGAYTGHRFSFGYGCCPELQSQKLLLDILEADRIGVSVNDSMQMEPELSVTAGVVA